MPNEKSEPIRKVIGVRAQLSEDEKKRMIEEAREKEYRDQMSRERYAYERGFEKGLNKVYTKIAVNLLNTGMSIEDVAKVTMLEKSDVEKLKDNLPDAFAE